MRRSNTQSLGEVLKDYVRAMKLQSGLTETRVIKSWYELMGKTIADATLNVTIKNKVMFVHLNSAVIRGELVMMRQKIIDAINTKAGAQVIEDLILR